MTSSSPCPFDSGIKSLRWGIFPIFQMTPLLMQGKLARPRCRLQRGPTGMLPAKPQHSRKRQAPNRAAGAPLSGGIRATVHAPNGNSRYSEFIAQTMPVGTLVKRARFGRPLPLSGGGVHYGLRWSSSAETLRLRDAKKHSREASRARKPRYLRSSK